MNQIYDKAIAWIPREDIEEKALEQIKNISEMPFIYKHVAVMPDCHLGRGATVGTCLPTEGAIIPAAVGVDIGCGMIAVKTPLFKKDLPEDLERLHHSIERAIPLSAGKSNQTITPSAHDRIKELEDIARGVDYSEFSQHWKLQLGTLGSGNHFIEITLDETDQVWAFLHSGSRGVGNKIAMHHIDVAKNLMRKYHISLVDPDLAYLVEGTEEFDRYIKNLNWAQEYALKNREEMMDRVLTQLSYFVYGEDGHQKELELERIQCHHNFSQKENHCLTCIDILSNGSRKTARPLADSELSKVQDFLGDCRFLIHSCGGLLLMGVNGDPISSALPGDVLAQMEKPLLVHCEELLEKHSRVSLSDLCVCVFPNYTDAKLSTSESKFGQDFSRLFVDGKKSDKLDKILAGLALNVFPYNSSITCSPLHKKVNVWISRKGAIQAQKGQLGLIPGSMGTASYVVRGLGNVPSFNTAPHGAGRNFSRTEARRRFTMEDFDRDMEGIVVTRSKEFLDELPGAYKDIDVIMERSKDLVEIVHKFSQIINVKGN